MDQQRGETNKSIPDSTAHDDVWLIAFLRDRDEHCPSCQYILRRLTSSRCPECGQWLRLGVAAVEPSLTAWTILVCSLSSVVGIAMMFAAIMLRAWSLSGQLLLPNGQMGLAMWISFLGPLAFPFAITRRTQFLLIRPHIQRYIAWAGLIVLLATLTLVHLGGP